MRRPDPHMPPHEKGAAMVLVLGIVAVMSSMAIFSFDSLSRLIALTSAKTQQAQTRHYALGAEMLAIDVSRQLVRERAPLRRLIKDGGNKFQQNIDGANVVGELNDATNCFNLTSMVTGNYANGWQADMDAIAQFAALLQHKGLGPQAARAMAAAVADWQDSDSRALRQGAESDYYADRAPGYQVPNAPMRSVSEMRLVRDVTPALMQELGDLLCVDGVQQKNFINVNMLQARHAPLLSALLGSEVSAAAMRSVIAQQPEQGFTDISRFWAHPEFAYVSIPRKQKAAFSAHPRRLRVAVDVDLAGVRNRLKSDIHFYPNGTYTIISRAFGAL